MRHAAGFILALCVSLPAHAAGPVDETYVRSLAAPGKTVLVIEYYDGQGKVAERKGFASASGFRVASATDFRVDADLTVHLYGIEPCEGDMVNRNEDFAGSCEDYARRGLETLLQSPRVIYCRAFVSETEAQAQDATCYGYYSYPGSMDSVDMFERQLVSLGSHRITKRPDGTLARADLKEAEDIGRRGYGIVGGSKGCGTMKAPALFMALTVGLTPATAAPPEGYFELKLGVTLESGDSWQDNGQRFRLFGVQACLRGTVYTDKSGARRDCGEVSLAVFAAYITDTNPVCAQVAQSAGAVIVSCYATIGADRLDLANLMISSGFAFASLDGRGLPHHTPYAVLEQAARETRVGLWRFDDVQHPAILLGQIAAGGGTSP